MCMLYVWNLPFLRKSHMPSRAGILICLLCCVALASCHSSKNSSRWEDSIYAGKGNEKKNGTSTSGFKDASEKAKKVIEAAVDWIGAPYLYGGNSKKGVDCSGLVCMAFEKGAGIKLPRASHEQQKWCASIPYKKIEPGDLVFFTSKKGGDRVNHVAIYIGDGQIIHSTTSRGVIISDMKEEYWTAHFYSCGRVPDKKD